MDWKLEQIFEQLLRNSVGGGLLVALFLLGVILSRGRLGPKWGVVIALLVFVRLLLPTTPEIGPKISLLERSVERPAVINPVENEKSLIELKNIVAPLTSAEIAWLEDLPMPIRERDLSPVVPSSLLVTPPTKRFVLLRLSFFWLAGAVGLAVLILGGHIRLATRIRRRARPTDPSLNAILLECCEQMQISRRVSLLVLPGLSSASLFGTWKPRLLLPHEYETGFSREELRAIFLHELAHLRRQDLWWNWLGCLVLCLHWFNPMVWILVRRFRADREQLCDQLAVDNLPDSGIYSATLMKLLRDFSSGSPASVSLRPGMASVLTRKSEIKQRIIMIHETSRNSLVPKLLTIAALVAVGWMTFPSFAEEKEKKDSDPPRAEREAGREGDRDHPEARDARREGGRDQPESRGRGDGDRDHPEARKEGDRDNPEGRPKRGDGDREHPERQAAQRDGDRKVAPERRDPGAAGQGAEMQARARERAAQMEKMHKAFADARRAGREEEAEAIEGKIREFHEQMKRDTVVGRGEPQPNPRGEAEARMHHMRVAAENLERAGLAKEAGHYREKAEHIQRELEQSRGGNHGPEAAHTERLQREVHELHEVVGDLRRKVQELEEQLRGSKR